ncbi:MAG: hypothetical protein IAE81_22385, partial [Caldilineaceae bacterium]|nr:hypothetical protein [Caldilineaceae bacterium]
MFSIKRLWGIAFVLALAFSLAGCITVNPGFRQPTPAPQTPAQFVSTLIAALVSRDGEELRSSMGDVFVWALWQDAAEAQLLTPDDAITEILAQLVEPAQSITFVSNDVVNAWLNGVDVLALWPPDVKVVDAIGVSVSNADGADEAILVIAEDPAGRLYWYALLLAKGGFANHSGVVRPIVIAPPQSPQGILPTDITEVLVLGAVGIFDGPGATFRQIGLAARGETYAVSGISADGQWWAITCNLGVQPCWLGANPTFVRPVTQPPAPAPTHTPR